VLGTWQLWPSNAYFFLLKTLCFKHVLTVLNLMSCFWQIGDGFWNQRSTPVTVHGLNSGVLFLAAGAVRLLNCFDIEPDA
jgi:hypothetical protein